METGPPACGVAGGAVTEGAGVEVAETEGMEADGKAAGLKVEADGSTVVSTFPIIWASRYFGTRIKSAGLILSCSGVCPTYFVNFPLAFRL